MELTPIAAAPPSFITPASGIESVRDLFARDSESFFDTGESTGFPSTMVELSAPGRLLSALAGLSDVVNEVETGSATENAAVIVEAQRFVDIVNALNLDRQLSTLLDPVTTAPVIGSAVPGTPGFDGALLGRDGDSFALNIDALNIAMNSGAPGATNQLTELVETVAQTVVTDRALGAPALTGEVRNSFDVDLSDTESLVPDLLARNVRLREALADNQLQDIVLMTASVAGDPLLAANTQRDSGPEAQAALAAPGTQPPVPPPANAVSAKPQGANTALANATNVASDNPLIDAGTAVQTEAMLSLATLAPTALEQVTLLATNPTVAGAVAAFQVSLDVSDRSSRVLASPGLAVMNPTEAVAAANAVAPRLANNGEQRREQSPNARVNQWLAMQPRLL